MEYAPAISAKPSVFVRVNFLLGLLTFSLLPLLVALGGDAVDGSVEAIDVEQLLAAMAALQGLVWFAHFRCGTADRPYFRSLLTIAACLSTGWSYLDVVIVAVGLFAAILASCLIAMTRDAPEQFSQLVYWFYTHRMHQ